MPLKASELHQCILCPYKSIRKDMKKHLTSAGKKGPRCPCLKKVIPSDIWTQQILPHYTENFIILDDVKRYIDETYSSHYSTPQKQATEIINSLL